MNQYAKPVPTSGSRSGPGRDRLVDRAMMASGALVAAAVVTTGVFIGKIANSSASTVSKNNTTGATTTDNGNGGFGDDNGGSDNGGFPSQNGGSQNGGVLPNQNNLPPVGGSNGS